MKKLIGFVINHTHMDIEWYYPLDSYAPWFIETVGILDKICRNEPDYGSFVFDGCVYPLREAIRRKPSIAESVQRLVQSGKLAVGPFYTQFDELIPSGESIIMNCLWGKRFTQEFGRNTRAGYLPDNFGHPAQLPQILRGFGIDSLMFMRGMYRENTSSEFLFVSPDGSSVNAVNSSYSGGLNIYQNNNVHPPIPITLPYYKSALSDYTYLKALSQHIDHVGIAHQFIEKVRAESGKFPSRIVPLFCGCDHCPPHEGISETIRLANEIQNEIEFIMGDTEQYAALLRERTESASLYKYSGDLLGSVSDVRLFGVFTSRIYQKIQNFECEKQLFFYALPLCAFAEALGNKVDKTVLDEAIEKLLLNSTHDSIHGGGSDAVHLENEYRNSSISQICATSSNAALAQISSNIGMAVEGDGSFLVYTPILRGISPAFVYLSIGEEEIEIYDEFGEIVPHEIIKPRIPENNSVGQPYYYNFIDDSIKKVYFTVSSTSPCVSRYTYKMTDLHSAYAWESSENFIENEFIRISVDGVRFSMTDLSNGQRWENICRLCDEADAGDEFDFSPPWNECKTIDFSDSACNVKISVRKGSIVSTISTSFDVYLPECLEIDTRSEHLMRTTFKISCNLYRGIHRTDFKLEFENRTADHRLRLLIPRIAIRSMISTGGLFMENEYNPDKYLGDEGESGHTCRELPFRDYIAERDENGGMTSVFRGLYAYEVYNESIAVTLLRSVGMLFKKNLREREAGCVGAIETPAAQCKRQLTLEWCCIPFSIDDSVSFYTDMAESYLAPPQTYTETYNYKFNVNLKSFFTPFYIETDSNVKLSVIRRTLDGEYAVLRLYEYEGKCGNIQIKSNIYNVCYLASLDETVNEQIEMNDGIVRYTVTPHKIITFLFK